VLCVDIIYYISTFIILGAHGLVSLSPRWEIVSCLHLTSYKPVHHCAVTTSKSTKHSALGRIVVQNSFHLLGIIIQLSGIFCRSIIRCAEETVGNMYCIFI
jgi:hypothetical protein